MTRSFRDPVTGDELTSGERISWIIQGIIRNWTFLIVITIVTAIAWLTRNDQVLLWWNLSASYLAIVIESIVGLGMYQQTRRDAKILREVRTISQRIEKLAEVQTSLINQLSTDVDDIDSRLGENTIDVELEEATTP